MQNGHHYGEVEPSCSWSGSPTPGYATPLSRIIRFLVEHRSLAALLAGTGPKTAQSGASHNSSSGFSAKMTLNPLKSYLKRFLYKTHRKALRIDENRGLTC